MIKYNILKILVLIFGMSFLHSFSYGQAPRKFKGVIINENNNPLAGASVVIYSLNKGCVTDSNGKFIINDLSENNYEINISFLGYKTLMKTVSLTENKVYKFQLEVSSTTLDEVVVRDNYTEDKRKETSLSIEVVDDTYLKQNLGGSLMKSIERLPGVTTIDIGSGQSKPVIRGLGFNRVVVVENNIKHEAQQWGADHGLEIDQYAVENIEIIKGPASLMYGSDAIGGVIDMKNSTIPEKNSYGATIDLSGKSNNDFLGTSVSLFARKNHFFATGRVTFLDYGDYKVPTDSVDIYNYRVPLYKNHIRNSAGYERNIHTSFGIVKDQFQSRFYVSNVSSQSGFFANAHGLEPRRVNHEIHDASDRDIHYPHQKVNHFKLINRSSFFSTKWNVEFDLGYQRNYREEWSQYTQHGYMPAVFPETLDFNPEIERQFQKDIYSGNLNFFYELSDNIELNMGINGEYQENEIGGRGFIIPSYKRLNLGTFVFAKYAFSEKSLIQAGIRYDYGNINTKNHLDWFLSPSYLENGDTTNIYVSRAKTIDRDFSNFTWSIGYNYNPDEWSFKFNIGKSFRMPIAKELAANGINYHRFSYEVGDADLSPEISYQFDAGIEYHTEKFALGVSPFINYFPTYIYLNPTSQYDRLYGFGNQVFEYTESEVFRYGGELYASYDIFKFLQLGVVGEYVYAEQLSGAKKGYTLPFAPPASAIFNIKYHQPKIKFVNNAYLSLDYRLTSAQNNIVPPEETTDGFQVINLGLGGDIAFKNQHINIAIQVQNLLNTRYFNHTSYYRLINVPEAGRNLIINLSIPFSGKIKQDSLGI